MPTNPSFPLGRVHAGYGGGSYIFDQTSSSFSKSFVFRTRNANYTETEGVLKIEADFLFPLPYTYSYDGKFTSGKAQHSHFSSVRPGMGRELVRLLLEGFWSESSGKLCMVGSRRMKNGNDVDFNAVLKLENVKNSGSVTSLISGTLECLSSGDGSYCFDSISVLMLPQKNYEYTLVSKEFGGGHLDGGNVVKNLPFSSMPESSFCNEGWWPPNGFNLRYAPACQSAKNCDPFGGSAEDLPHVMFLSGFGCSDKESRLRVLVEFYTSRSSGFYQPFYPNRTLVGEGYWDENKLSVIACRFLDVVESLAGARVADCSTRLSLSFSAILSVQETTNVVGEIWTNRTVNDPGYFDRIMFRSSESRIVGVPAMKYEYTATDRVRKSCRKTKPVRNNRDRYPNGNSIHMRFDMSVGSSEGKIARGYAIPFSIGDQFYEKNLDEASLSSLRPANSAVNAKFSSPVNMSYKIGFKIPPGVNLSEGISLFTRSSIFNEVEIFAEGIYNERSGGLCMAGCRIVDYNETDSLDCGILLKFQFPPLGEEKNEGNIKGSIESLREKTDPFYFKPLETFSSDYAIEAQWFIWRMDMEIAMALISCTLAIVFVGLQHLHTKRHPKVLPLISLVMLSILTLGYLMPPLVHLGSLFLQNVDQQRHFLGKGGSLEASEVVVDLVKMVVFFFQFRLLQRTWIARFSDERHKGLWLVEKTTFLMSVPLYAAGTLIDLLVNWNEWLDLKSYAGVILDGFLLPQILLNIFGNSKENALSGSFYIGNTFLQLLPHVYNLCEAYTPTIGKRYDDVIAILYHLSNIMVKKELA
ncbi:uncharacterized protein LOC131174091 [Hevea brasiliensis]|uniref:uncharacterized protein LOC131174091 n=1 Tax=Hevea brasiliensis TaxID=3981 RepID=UPI0025F60643|nr:uncharacterized protein LOC131174091 [Hevea brasiliensis]